MGLVIGEDAVPHALVRRHAEHFQKGGTPAQEGGLRIDPELGNPARQRVVERPLLGGMPQGCLGLVLGAAGEQDAVRPAYGGGEGQQGENGMALAAIGLLEIQLQRGERGRKDVTQLLRREKLFQHGHTAGRDLAAQKRAQFCQRALLAGQAGRAGIVLVRVKVQHIGKQITAGGERRGRYRAGTGGGSIPLLLRKRTGEHLRLCAVLPANGRDRGVREVGAEASGGQPGR